MSYVIHDLFSKRQRRQRGETPDVLQCETLPIDLKKQVGMLIEETLGNSSTPNKELAAHVYAQIIQALAEEWARPELLPLRFERYFEKPLVDIFIDEPDVERSLDVIELVFRCADREAGNPEYYPGFDGRRHVDDCIEEMNIRFKEHGVGYAFVNDEIIRVDSEVIHTEVVTPVVHFLNAPGFEGPQEEFFTAHAHYRHGFYKEAITAANKAFESTMKVICEQKGWEYKKGDTARKLIMTCIDKGLFPSYYQSHLSALSNLLEGGVPAIRNNEGGHG